MPFRKNLEKKNIKDKILSEWNTNPNLHQPSTNGYLASWRFIHGW